MLRDLGRGLEGVYQGVMELLEEKRANFPRFYFLSNNEMVDVLVRCGARGEWQVDTLVRGGRGRGEGGGGGRSRTAAIYYPSDDRFMSL